MRLKRPFADRLLELLTTKKDAKIRYTISFCEALSSGDVNNIKEFFNTFFNELSKELVTVFNEACFKDVLLQCLPLMYQHQQR